ncbi:MAG: hypothetical protein HC881_02390 [Leptolyngbyaceae cyanobacterium SL_7_1]|nr:hypothetical protein [Leptolyngbyaceae cyanobacterium SL_7_1]
MILVICPGIHDTALTQAFLADMRSIAPTQEWVQPLVFPAERSPTYSSLHVLNFLVEENSRRATPNRRYPQCY